MKKRKRTSGTGSGIDIGDISDISGNVNVAGGNITTHHTTTGLRAAEIKQLFDQLYTRIDARAETSTADKEDLKAEVKEIQATFTEAAQKNEKVDEGLLSRRFRNIARMAPDVLDMTVAAVGHPAFGHPSLGLGAAVKKIAEKAKEETKQG